VVSRGPGRSARRKGYYVFDIQPNRLISVQQKKLNLVILTRETSPYVNRIRLLWQNHYFGEHKLFFRVQTYLLACTHSSRIWFLQSV
jgi:hypothetical protein